MKKYLLLFIIVFGFSSIYSQTTPTIEGVVEQINIDSLLFYVEQLSGETNVFVNNQTTTIVSRHKNNPDNAKSADYLYEKLSEYGLTVSKQDFSSTGRNIYATQLGYKYPNQKLIICAHFDSQPSGAKAPGADDNASGTAAVIEAARILNNYSFPFTIVYALWDEEEQGLIGSAYYAQQARNNGDTIVAVVNMDMIAWNRSNSKVVEIHTRNIANSNEIADKMLTLVSQLNLDLIPVIKNPGATYSDHASFWTHNYGAILLIEDDNDFNAYYHTIGDTIGNFNIPYFLDCSKLSIATLVAYAVDQNITLHHNQIVSTNNPLNITAELTIDSGMEIGTDISSPTLYYRVNEGTGFSSFNTITGTLLFPNSSYVFNFPELNLGSLIEYYIAVQDTGSQLVTSLPKGAGGFNPPGSIPPPTMYSFFVANQTIIYMDSLNTADNWVFTGGAGLSNSLWYTPLYSATDSPNGQYPANCNATIKLKNPITIPAVVGAELKFNARWQIESDYDYAMVQISTNNGSTWLSQPGKFTNPGTGDFQPSNQPLYDGEQTTWINEIININDYVGKDILIQYILKSDSYVQDEGINVDDIEIIIYDKATPVEDDNVNIVTDYQLFNNYPNPFNGSTNISFALPKQSNVSLNVYDILGNKVITLYEGNLSAGKHNYTLNTSSSSLNLASGIYFYTLHADNFIQTKKLILLK